jgi:hypothetical protein
MSIAQTAILATALRPKSSDGVSKPKTTSITESIAQRPIQWLVVAGAVVYFGGKFIKNVIPSGVNLRKDEAETATSADNPWSAVTFLNQPNIPKTTKFLKAETAYKEAKKIYDALNTFFADDADIVVGVFAALPSKLQVAQVVKSFEAYYKRNILEYLKSGKKTFDFGTGGISTELYNRIIENVKRKPKF